jgi:hypothetical protein
VFYSPWLFPIYKYNGTKNDIEPHKTPAILIIITCVVVLLWGILTSVYVKPVWIGVCITIVAEIFIIQLSIYLIYSGSAHKEEVEDFIDELVVKQAWLDSKANFVNMLGISERCEYVSYEKWWRRRFHLNNYIRSIRGSTLNLPPERDEFHLDRKELEEAGDKKAYHRGKLEGWVDVEIYNLDSCEDMLALLYETDVDLRAAYMNELELIIQFQLLIV